MSTTPNGVTALTPDTHTPPMLTHIVTVLLVAVPIVLSVWKPNGSFNSTTAQAVIVAVGVFFAGLLHLAMVLSKNRLTRAGLEKSFCEEEQWVKANWSTLQLTFVGAQKALNNVPNLPERLAGVEAATQSVKADVEAVKGQIDQLPKSQQVSIEHLATELAKQLNPQPSAQPWAS